MTTAVEAIYEVDDPERQAWLAQSERRLHDVWDNDADDVFNTLLAE